MAVRRKVQPGESVDDWAIRQEQSALIQYLVSRFRREPSLTERVMWSAPWYIGRDKVFYVASFPTYATLGMCFGAHLDNPDGLLEGTGKDMRHVKIRREADLLRPEVESLIGAALAFDQRDSGEPAERLNEAARETR